MTRRTTAELDFMDLYDGGAGDDPLGYFSIQVGESGALLRIHEIEHDESWLERPPIISKRKGKPK